MIDEDISYRASEWSSLLFGFHLQFDKAGFERPILSTSHTCTMITAAILNSCSLFSARITGKSEMSGRSICLCIGEKRPSFQYVVRLDLRMTVPAAYVLLRIVTGYISAPCIRTMWTTPVSRIRHNFVIPSDSAVRRCPDRA